MNQNSQKINDTMKVQDTVTNMYNQIPYPEYGDKPLEEKYVREKEHIDLCLDFNGEGYSIYNDKKVLDAGAGTCRESMYIASKGGKVTSLDVTKKSLEVGKKFSKKYNFASPINFKLGSVLELPFENDSFDIVLSSGVIHHTAEPEKAFSEIARVCRPNGYIILFVYDNWAHKISNIRRSIVNIICGNDIHKRAIIAQKIFPFYCRRNTLASIYDEFSHPHKSEHTLKEITGWFNNNNIKPLATYPKLGVKGFIDTIQSKREYLSTKKYHSIDTSIKNINFSKRLSSGFVQFLIGFLQYSGGYRFIGQRVKHQNS